MNVDLQ